jgi:hypothetical protein
MEQIKAIVKEQIDVLNAIPKRNIGVAREREISQVPVMSAFFDFDYCGDATWYLWKLSAQAATCMAVWDYEGWNALPHSPLPISPKISRIGLMILTIQRRQGQSSLSKIRTTKSTRYSIQSITTVCRLALALIRIKTCILCPYT